MAASLLKKDILASTTPYLWNTSPRPAAVPAPTWQTAPLNINHEKDLEERYERGYRDGEAAAKAAKADAALGELAETIANLAQTRSSLFRSVQGDVLRLAMAVARRILHREILMSPDVLGGVISVALERIEESDLHTVHVHPSFADRIEELLSGRTNGRKVDVIGDQTLPLGGCVFETQHGTVDAGLESQLSEIERGLADHLEVLR
jgi:flagellar assembly protein FliH